MARKRDRYTRLTAKRTRPALPGPTDGWVIGELARIAQVPLRTLRYYVQLNLLVPSEFRGTATRYQRRELLRLLGILRLKSEARISLEEIKRQLHALSEKQLEAWLLARPLPPTAAIALGLATPGTDAKRVAASVPADAADSRLGGHASLAPATSTWQRVSLLPGLELMISADASPAVQRAAHSICAEYVGAK